MKKIMIPVLIAGLTLTACKKTETASTDAVSETAQANPENDSATTTQLPTGDTTETSVDWDGTYKGKLPCASCPGIETTLTLNNDKTYTLEENYLEEKDGNFKEKGNFSFSADGSFITLNNGEKDGLQKVFFVGENQIFMAEKVGDRTAKEEYKLVKQ